MASFLVAGQPLLVTVSVTLAAIMEGRAGHPIDWLDYPPLAALGYDRIANVLDQHLGASEIPLTAEDADALLALDRYWWSAADALTRHDIAYVSQPRWRSTSAPSRPSCTSCAVPLFSG